MNLYLITCVVSYLLGSVPCGYLLVRLVYGKDVRSGGSGNIGATNVMRTSRALGIATLLLDAGKGFAAVAIAKSLFPGQHQAIMMTVAAFFAVVGHVFPIWLSFRGGKGVATSLGSLLMIAPKSILCVACIFVIVVVAFRYISLGSIVAAAVLPIAAWSLHEYDDARQLVILAATSLLIVWKHRQNVNRLVAGTEAKFGGKRA